MKKSIKILPLVAGVVAILLFQSCTKDDNSEQEPLEYPHTVYYKYNIDTEFRMWTNGQEIYTNNLSIRDYSEPLYAYSQPNSNELEAGYIFTRDSLTAPGSLFGPVVQPYIVRNDSIFYVAQVPVYPTGYETQYLFFTFGNQREIRFEKGAFFIKNGQTGDAGFFLSKNSYFTRDDVSRINNYQVELEDFQVGDTLIIYNSTLVFN